MGGVDYRLCKSQTHSKSWDIRLLNVARELYANIIYIDLAIRKTFNTNQFPCNTHATRVLSLQGKVFIFVHFIKMKL